MSCEHDGVAVNTQLSAPRPTSHRHRVVGVRRKVVERQLAVVTGNATVSCFAWKQQTKMFYFNILNVYTDSVEQQQWNMS